MFAYTSSVMPNRAGLKESSQAVVVLKVDSLESFDSSLQVAVLDLPQGRRVNDLHLTSSGKLTLVTVADLQRQSLQTTVTVKLQDCELNIVDPSSFSWHRVTNSKTSSLQHHVESIIREGLATSWSTEQTKALDDRTFAFISSNRKGLMSVSNGNNINIVNISD